MPARSAAHRRAASRRMEESVSERQVEDFADTKRTGKPEHADD